MVITIFGLGFVGLTSALGFAEKGNVVYGADTNKSRADKIKNNIIPFEEPGLPEALSRHNNKSFFVTEDIKSAVKESDCIFYCVGTPYGNDGSADLTFLYQAIDQTLEYIDDNKFRLLVIKSTVPPSTTKSKIIPYIESKDVKHTEHIGVANNPEFLREGCCWEDFINADRIVFGVSDKKSEDVLKQLYAPFGKPMFAVSLNTGEFIKYLSNTMLAALISYSNEMANAAYEIGDIEIAKAFKILHTDGRWVSGKSGEPCKMTSYVYPGCGYGGYCLPKDTNAFRSLMRGFGFDMRLLSDVIKINDEMPKVTADKITKTVDKRAVIGVLGLSFKPMSDDVRQSPSASIIAELIGRGYNNIIAYDPIAAEKFKESYNLPIGYAGAMAEVTEKSDVIAITTAWDEFKGINNITDKPIIDCRYVL